MPRGEIVKIKSIVFLVLSGIILLALTSTLGTAQSDNITSDDVAEISDDIEPYEGSAGPGSVLYGLKIAFEDLDEGFTFNVTRKLEKQEEHARLRIAEAKAELRRNNAQGAERALERYREKVEASGDLLSAVERNDTGLLLAQRRIIKHQFVLEQLRETHPNVTGLERAFNNSIGLEERFELRTRTRFERIETEDRRRIKIREAEREKIEIKAEIIGNASDVKVEIKFLTNLTMPEDIAREIQSRLNLSRENIGSLLEIEAEEEDMLRGRDELEARAEVRGGISEVEAELRFPLNTTNRSEIIERIQQKLSALTDNSILAALEFKARERREIRREIRREELEIKAETIGNASDVKIKLKFLTDLTTPEDISKEIQSRLNLSREEISSLLEIEAEQDRLRLREELEIEVEIEKGVTEVEFELRFPLNTSDRDQIVERIQQKLLTLNIDLNRMDIEIRERREDRREDGRDGRGGRDGEDGDDRGGSGGRGGRD